MTTPSATVVIATQNRKDDLRRAIQSAQMQEPAVDIVIVDDGSSDGTAEMVRAEFPQLTLIRHDTACGATASRNEGFGVATTEYIVGIDDDAYFEQPDTIAKTVAEFNHPRIAAIAIPFKENGQLLNNAPDSNGIYLTDFFIAAAHAVQKKAFFEVGGYRESLKIYVEEPDLSIRLLQAGYVTRLGSASPLVHAPHPARNRIARTAQRWKNEMLFKWYHTPLLWLFPSIIAHFIHVLREAISLSAFFVGVKSLLTTTVIMFKQWSERKPVDVSVFQAWRELRAQHATQLERIAPLLPDIS